MFSCSLTMRFGLVAITLAVTACVTPQHSNTLVFATNTTAALDVSVSPSGTAAMPSLTLGYKRQEGVWMPLLANAKGAVSADGSEERTPAACGAIHDPCTFRGKDGENYDTYSVLGTFSGDVKGEANAGTNTVSGGGQIAQYFATGFAARYLALRSGAALVSTAAIDPAIQTLIDGQLKQQEANLKKISDYLGDSAASDYGEKLNGLLTKSSADETLRKDLMSLKLKQDLLDRLKLLVGLATELAAAVPTGPTAYTTPGLQPGVATPAATKQGQQGGGQQAKQIQLRKQGS